MACTLDLVGYMGTLLLSFGLGGLVGFGLRRLLEERREAIAKRTFVTA